MAVRHLARALAREHQHRADAAVDVDPGIALGRAGGVRELVELGLEVEQALAERAQHGRALVKGHRPQRGAAGLARVAQHRREVDARRSPPPRRRRRCSRRAARSARPPPSCHVPLTKLCRRIAFSRSCASTGRARGLPGRECRAFAREPRQQPAGSQYRSAVLAREAAQPVPARRRARAYPRRTSGRRGAAESRSHCTRSRRCRRDFPRCPRPGSARPR